MSRPVAPAAFVSAFSQLPTRPDRAGALTKQAKLFLDQRILTTGTEKLSFPYKAVFLSKMEGLIVNCFTQVIGTKFTPGNLESLRRFCAEGLEGMEDKLRTQELNAASVVTVYMIFLKTQETAISFYAQKVRCSAATSSQATTTMGERISTENGRRFIAAYCNPSESVTSADNDEVMRFLFPSAEPTASSMIVDLTNQDPLPSQLKTGEQ